MPFRLKKSAILVGDICIRMRRKKKILTYSGSLGIDYLKLVPLKAGSLEYFFCLCVFSYEYEAL